MYGPTLTKLTTAPKRLPDSTIRVAVHLLASVHPDTGTLTLTWDDYLIIARGKNRTAARRHLSRLAAAQVIHYSTNDLIYIRFSTWPIPNQYPQDTKSVSPGYQNGTHTTPGQNGPTYRSGIIPENLIPDRYHEHTGSARIRANPPHTPPSQLVSLIDSSTDTNELVKEADPRTISLLTDPDVGIDPDTAARLAIEHEFSWIQRQVAKWWSQIQTGQSTGPGGLLHRINCKWGPGPFPEKFKTTELYQRHWTQAEDTTDLADAWADYT